MRLLPVVGSMTIPSVLTVLLTLRLIIPALPISLTLRKPVRGSRMIIPVAVVLLVPLLLLRRLCVLLLLVRLLVLTLRRRSLLLVTPLMRRVDGLGGIVAVELVDEFVEEAHVDRVKSVW